MKFDYTIEGTVLKKYNAPILGCDTEATVPDGITAIDRAAFYYIRGLDRAVLPDSVVSIGEEAFYMCEGLDSVKMPRHLDELGARAFAHCHSLRSIVIPEGVSVIYENTFYKCESLTEVYLPRSLTRIEPGAFDGCYLLADTHYAGTREEWEKKVTGGPGIKRMTFLGYEESDAERIDPNDYTVEEGVLVGYSGSEATVFVPKGVHTVGAESFHGLFRDRPMHRLVLPEGVTRIEPFAFQFEEKLKEIIIPKSLKSVPSDAFFACDGPERVIYRGTRAEWTAISGNMQIGSPLTVECTDGVL